MAAGRLDGKVAIVTGAGRGNGRAIAGIFGAQGATVLVVDRDEDVAAKAASDLTAGDPEDVGYAALFLASDEAKYVTGQTLVVEGGQILPESKLAIL